MDLLAVLPAFAVAVLLISASPGPAMALILRRAAANGFRGALPTVLGLEAGLYAWALMAAGGLAALVAVSEAAFLVLRVVGAAVLLAMGVQALRSAWRGHDHEPPAHVAPAGPRRGQDLRAFGEGFVVMLANPKAAVFMVAFYPQFIPAGHPLFATTALLAAVQVLIELVVYLSLAAAVARAGAWLSRPKVRRRLDAVSGGVLVALGIRVAATSR